MNQRIPALQELGEEFERVVARSGAAEGGRSGRATRALRRLPALAGPASAVVVALAVGAGALLLAGGHRVQTARAPVPRSAVPAPGRRQLIAILGLLRRPQVPADLDPALLSRTALAVSGIPDRPLIRFATVTPWGERLYLVPLKPPTAQELARSDGGLRLPASLVARLRARGETVAVESLRGGGGGGTAAAVEAGRAVETEGAGRSFAGGSTRTRVILIVPDGVSRVTFVLPRQPQPRTPGAPTYRHSARVTVAVHGNIAAVALDREFDGMTPPMIWSAADGRVIRRIGHLAGVDRVVPPPRPGPPTPQSRAAQRDPSTPNRVWVTPAAGGPHTDFVLHFRVLLSDADYSYRLTGPRCPAITANRGDGGGGAAGLRGRIWSDEVDAVRGQTWCPGTYQLSATVLDLGRAGPLRHPVTPFGTASFTVRP